MRVLAPGRFSTITGWFHCLPKRSQIRRVRRSGLLPGALGMITRTGFAGQSWAGALRGSAPRAALASSRARRLASMRFSSGGHGFGREARYHLAREQGGRTQRFLVGEIAEGQARQHVVDARRLDLPRE